MDNETLPSAPPGGPHRVFLSGNVFNFGPNFERVAAYLRTAGYDVTVGPRAAPGVQMEFPRAELAALFGRMDAIVTSAQENYSRDVLAAAGRLRVLVSPWLGLENIDMASATELGIPIGFAAQPENYLGVAEATVACLGVLMKQIRQKERSLLESGWSGPHDGRMIRGKTVGLVGFGRVGAAVAARLQGWEVRLLVADPYTDASRIEAAGGRLVPLETVLRESDVISLHAFLSPETRGLIGEAQLRLMKPTAFLINMSRGGLVDEGALTRALVDRRIAGAALDVFAAEPLPADSPLRALCGDRLILTPHNAGNGIEGADASLRTVAENLARGLAGEPPLYLSNPDVLPAWRARLARLAAQGSV